MFPIQSDIEQNNLKWFPSMIVYVHRGDQHVDIDIKFLLLSITGLDDIVEDES